MPKLTALKVSSIKKRGLHGDGGGLYLQVSARGFKSWIFRYRDNGKLRNHGLGSVTTVSLAEAREAALECRKLRLQGIDPIEAKNQKRAAERLEAAKAITFAECASAYIEGNRSSWKNKKHIYQWEMTLSKYAFPVFGNLPVSAVDTTLVLQVLEPIWLKYNETAKRLRGRIERVLDWAKVRGYREGENPAAWKGNLVLTLPATNRSARVKHQPALHYTQMSAFWRELCKQPGIPAKALRFTILTAARTSETLLATWDEVDFETAVWTLSEERMKGEEEHRVPLPPQAMAILKEQYARRTSDYIFPGTKPGQPYCIAVMITLLRRMKRNDISVHGFRSTFRDWAADCVRVPDKVPEVALAHKPGDKTELAYLRTRFIDQRRPLMAQWEAFCEGKTGCKPVNRIG